MVRSKRIDLPFTLYHVFSRTNSGSRAFWDRRDYERFLEYIGKYSALFSFRVHTWCLLPTHFHLLLESTSYIGLSEFMRRLLTAYTIYFNKRHTSHGHLFQGRFKSLVVDKGDYLLALSRYIHLNPLMTLPRIDPETYEWSSLRYYINGGGPEFLYENEILNWFKGKRSRYAIFVRKGLDEDTKPPVLEQRFVGGKAFARRLKRRLDVFKKTTETGVETLSPSMRSKKDDKFEAGRAGEIAKRVAQEFQCGVESLRMKRYMRGDMGRAQAILIGLLRIEMSWTIHQIAKYMNLKNECGVYYYLKRLRTDESAKHYYEFIKRSLMY